MWNIRTWARPSRVAPGSAIAEQLALMESLTRGDISTHEFAKGWYIARRRAMDADERVREPFGDLLNAIFYDLEDFAIDPTLREEGDTTDEQLISDVQDVLHKLNQL